MNNEPNCEDTERPTTEEVEVALHTALRDEGRLFPTTDDEIAALEDSLDLTAMPTPDANGFVAKLRNQRESKVIPMGPRKEVEAATENLAMAARNGRAIPVAVRRTMDELRKRYEQSKKTSNDGTR